jgi:peroxiredoxin Q/BCP
MLLFFKENFWLILFIFWGLPLSYYRSKFRKIVYQTDSWTINFLPYFWKELKALFGNIYPENKEYLKLRNFYRAYLMVYILLSAGYFTFNGNRNMSRVEVGSTIPQFCLRDQNNNLFNINSVLGKKTLVIFFYPKDDSPGCTREACYFRDQFAVFEEVDAVVIGISGQSVESHKSFAEKHGLAYTLLSDEGNKVRKLFDVPTKMFGLLPGRVTYVVDKSEKVVFTFDSQIQAEKHVDEALRILKFLK